MLLFKCSSLSPGVSYSNALAVSLNVTEMEHYEWWLIWSTVSDLRERCQFQSRRPVVHTIQSFIPRTMISRVSIPGWYGWRQPMLTAEKSLRRKGAPI